MKRGLRLVPLLLLVLVPPAHAEASGGTGADSSPLPAIPGVTADDPFPHGCVDCHVKLPDRDVRLSTIMGKWHQTGVEPELLAKLRAFVPAGFTLKGRHPAVDDAGRDIPAACMECHGAAAPPLAPLLHGLHLTGGERNHFLTNFQGKCTYCHKFDPASGRWSLPSAPESSRSGAGAPGDKNGGLAGSLRILAEELRLVLTDAKEVEPRQSVPMTGLSSP